MSSIFRREFRGLFLGGTGWFCLIALVFAAGVLTTVNNFLSLSSDASRMFPVLCDLLILICPLLAAFGVTYDAAKGNRLWLRSLPLSRWAILGGKYLSALALLGICAAWFALFPLLIGIFGSVSYGTAYTALLGWFLIAAATLAVCFLVAARVRNRLLAVIFGVLVCAVLYFLPLLAAVIAAFPWVGMLLLILVGAGTSLPRILRDVRAKRVPLRGLLIFVPVCGAAVALFFAVRSFYTEVLTEALDFLSVFARLDGFRDGHLDVTGVVFLVSVTAVCLWGAVLLPDPGVRAGKEGMTREKP